MENGKPTNPLLILEYLPESQGFKFAYSGNMPIGLLIAQLEIIKANFVNQQLAMMNQAAQQEAARGIVGPNGMPVKRF